MSVSFIEDGHKYASFEDDIQIEWTSITSVIQMFHEHFDDKTQAYKCSTGQSKKKVYTGMTVNEILDLWASENKRATDLGHLYHLDKETELLKNSLVERENGLVPLYPPIMREGRKLAGPQKLTEGVYPEHLMYLKSAGICGQSDRVEIIKNFIDVFDHKTNKKLEFEGFKNRMNQAKKMLGVLSHLDDCNFIHYSIQLSLYMYMIRKHNYTLKPRRLELEHVVFKLKEKNKFDFPIYYTDDNGRAIVEDVQSYKVDYLEREAIAIVNFLMENPGFVKSYKLKKHGL